jgi:hypothetical protein
MVSLVAAIGARTSEPDILSLPEAAADWLTLLSALLAFVIIAEVVSRRLRGTS